MAAICAYSPLQVQSIQLTKEFCVALLASLGVPVEKHKILDLQVKVNTWDLAGAMTKSGCPLKISFELESTPSQIKIKNVSCTDDDSKLTLLAIIRFLLSVNHPKKTIISESLTGIGKTSTCKGANNCKLVVQSSFAQEIANFVRDKALLKNPLGLVDMEREWSSAQELMDANAKRIVEIEEKVSQKCANVHTLQDVLECGKVLAQLQSERERIEINDPKTLRTLLDGSGTMIDVVRMLTKENSELLKKLKKLENQVGKAADRVVENPVAAPIIPVDENDGIRVQPYPDINDGVQPTYPLIASPLPEPDSPETGLIGVGVDGVEGVEEDGVERVDLKPNSVCDEFIKECEENGLEGQKCFFNLAKKYHPDKKGGDTAKMQQLGQCKDKLTVSSLDGGTDPFDNDTTLLKDAILEIGESNNDDDAASVRSSATEDTAIPGNELVLKKEGRAEFNIDLIKDKAAHMVINMTDTTDENKKIQLKNIETYTFNTEDVNRIQLGHEKDIISKLIKM